MGVVKCVSKTRIRQQTVSRRSRSKTSRATALAHIAPWGFASPRPARSKVLTCSFLEYLRANHPSIETSSTQAFGAMRVGACLSSMHGGSFFDAPRHTCETIRRRPLDRTKEEESRELLANEARERDRWRGHCERSDAVPPPFVYAKTDIGRFAHLKDGGSNL